MKLNFFVHVPRTAGSSVWISLAHAAAAKGIGVCDLYHESLQRFQVPFRGQDALREILPLMGARHYVIHVHSAENMRLCLHQRRAQFATVLRDPVNRFVSDVFHHRRFFNNPQSPTDVLTATRNGLGETLAQIFCEPNYEPEEMLRLLAPLSTFQNYYIKFFSKMCGRTAGKKPGSHTEIRGLAARIRQYFAFIGEYEQLQGAYSEILQRFRVSEGTETLEHVINPGRDKPVLSAAVKARLARHFELDYALLDELRSSQTLLRAA